VGRSNNQQPLYIGNLTLYSPTKQTQDRAPKPTTQSISIGAQMQWYLIFANNWPQWMHTFFCSIHYTIDALFDKK
jgi:hypothetical protein